MVDVPVENQIPQTVLDVVYDEQADFDFDFRADDQSDLRVIYTSPAGVVTLLNPGVDFTAIGIGSASGGTVSLTSFLTQTNGKVAIYRSIPIERINDFSRDLFSEEINAEQDRIFMILQEIARDLGRALKVTIGETPYEFAATIEEGHALIMLNGMVSSGPSLEEIAEAGARAVEAMEFRDEAEVFRNEAAEFAELAKDNWVLAGSYLGTDVPETDFALSVDPGSAQNAWVFISGLKQKVPSETEGGAYSLVYVDEVPTIRLAENLPANAPIEILVGNSIEIGVPSDGSVSSAKIAEKAVTLVKLQDIPSLRFFGRVTAGDGPVELLTSAQLQAILAAPGSIVDSKYVRSTARVAMSTIIPLDGTIPQSTEGTEILTVAITPKTLGNKLRIRFRAFGSIDTGPNNLAYAIFRSGSVNALDAGSASVPAAGQRAQLTGEVEWTPPALVEYTISVRVGPGLAGNAWVNGNQTVNDFLTAGGATLVVEEIKG